MRGALRAALFAAHRYDAGCPKTGLCSLHSVFGKEVPCAPGACTKFVGPRLERDPEAVESARVRHLVHIESMVNVGCKFGPNDLDPATWEELIWLAMERGRMDRLVNAAKDRNRDAGAKDPKEEDALRKARELGGAGSAGATGASLLPRGGKPPRR